MDAREVVIVITGAHKSLALAKCIEEGVNHMWTVSAIQMHPKGLIVCDEDATLELHVKVINRQYSQKWAFIGRLVRVDRQIFQIHRACPIIRS